MAKNSTSPTKTEKAKPLRAQDVLPPELLAAADVIVSVSYESPTKTKTRAKAKPLATEDDR